jgi:tRNA U34 5-carboxymethylaminomethyl modifying enzyme MnmG/GidA
MKVSVAYTIIMKIGPKAIPSIEDKSREFKSLMNRLMELEKEGSHKLHPEDYLTFQRYKSQLPKKQESKDESSLKL